MGDTVTAFTSTNGTTFAQVAQDTIDLSATAEVGMAVFSVTAPTPTASATFDTFGVTAGSDAAPPIAALAANDAAGTQTAPYRFSVTYTDNELVDSSTIGSGNLVVTGPGGFSLSATLVSTGLTNNSVVTAVYSVNGLSTVGTYQVNLGANQVADSSGNFTAAGNLGTFQLVADTQPPAAAISSAPVITSTSPATYSFTVAYTDNGDVKASTIGNNNLTVTGPGGYNQAATLTSAGLTDGNEIDATYSIPRPTTNGAYTVTLANNVVQDVSGNAIAGGSIGNITVNLANAYIYGNVSRSGNGGLAGQHLWLDTNNNGVYDGGERTAVTDSSGNYFFAGVSSGVFHVRQYAGGGAKVVSPAGGGQDVTVASAQVVSGINFIDSFPTAFIYGSVTNQANVGLSNQHLWLDLNNDGLYQSNEPSVATDASGNFFFSGVTAGSYHLRQYSFPGTGVTSPAGGVANVTVAESQVVSGIVFKDASASAFIYGNVASATTNVGIAGQHFWLDTNNDGVYEAGELTATSDASGNYFFSGLLPGTYNVREFVPAGTTITTPANGVSVVALGEGKVVSGINFKNKVG